MEGDMIRAFAIAAAGLLATYAIRKLADTMQAQRVRAQKPDPQGPRAVTKLRQDPRTGVYYPEE
jgi:hypothetical protein